MMKKLFITIALILGGIYFAVVWLTGFYIEKTLSELDGYVNSTNDEKAIVHFEYQSTKKSLYSREGILVISSPLFKSCKTYFKSEIGFLRAEATLDVADLVKNLAATDYLPKDLNSNESNGLISTHVNVFKFEAYLKAKITSAYKKQNTGNLNIDLDAHMNMDMKPELTAAVDNYINPKIVSIHKGRLRAVADGVFPVKSIGSGTVTLEKVSLKQGDIGSLTASYKATPCDSQNNFAVDIDGKGKDIMGIFETLNLNASLSSLNLDRITGVTKVPDGSSYTDFILSSLNRADIKKSEFTISNKTALKIFKSTLNSVIFRAEGPMTFKYQNIPDTLNGKLKITTNSNGKILTVFMTKNAQGLNETELKIT
ncbi:MAG: hypothetical protein ACI4M9_06610, partial [Succinivibrio sp.]